MRKILAVLFFLAFVQGATAGEPTTDKVYATNLQYDEEFGLYFFDVILEGENLYTAYGIDIQLPEGMEVVDDGETIYVLMNEPMYPQNKITKKYSHSVFSNFPNKGDHSHLRVGCMSTLSANMVSTSGTLFRVYVSIDYAVGKWPLGVIRAYDVELVKSDASPFNAPNTETIVPIHTGETTLPLKISATSKWSTCVLPFATSIPEGVKAYVCERNDEQNIYLTEVAEQLNSYTPYILYAENGFDGNVSGTISADETPEKGVVANGYLNGAIIPQTATNGYILQKQNGVVKFYAIGSGDSFNIPAGKCWMTLPESVKAKSLGFKIETATGIEDVKAEESELIFDLLGRQRQEGEKGILIKNGKKILSL